MAVKTFSLPICDECGKAWLPDEGPARDDIRSYDAAERAKGKVGKPVRCGKCKSTKWDAIYRQSAQDVAKIEEKVQDVTAEDVAQTMDLPTAAVRKIMAQPAERPTLCRHRVLNCQICGENR